MTDNSDLIGKVIVLGGTKLNGKEAETIWGRITTIEEDGTLTAVVTNDDPRLNGKVRKGLDADDVRERMRLRRNA
jgi:hypothetical protein